LKKVTKNKHFLLKVEGGGELTQLPKYTTSTIGFFFISRKIRSQLESAIPQVRYFVQIRIEGCAERSMTVASRQSWSSVY